MCDLNKYNLLQLTKTFNLYNNNLGSKGKRYLKKTIEKYYEEILDDDDLSENVMKQQLQDDILPEVTHNEGKSTTVSADQQQQYGVSRTRPVIAAADVSGVEDNNQSNFLRELSLLKPLRKDPLR